MPLYEVFIPAKHGSGKKGVTVKVQATSWLLALRTGIQQIGEEQQTLSSVMCENRPDGSIIVKDPIQRRIFRIREHHATEPLAAAAEVRLHKEAAERAKSNREHAERLAKSTQEAEKAYRARLDAQQEAERLAHKRRSEARALLRGPTPTQRLVESQQRREREERERKAREEQEQRKADAQAAIDHRALLEREEAELQTKAQERRRERSKMEDARMKAEAAAARAEMEKQQAEEELRRRREEARKAADRAAQEAVGLARDSEVMEATMEEEEELEFLEEAASSDFDPDQALAYLFERTMDLYDVGEISSKQEAIELVMDLAMDVIKAEAGSVILSDYNSPLQDQYFAAARGPVKDEVMALRIPRGMGIVGLSVESGMTLAVSDAPANPQFYEAISKKTGFPTKSLLCVPLISEGRTLGAIELVNKIGSDKWTQSEMEVLGFLAKKAAESILEWIDRETKLVYE